MVHSIKHNHMSYGSVVNKTKTQCHIHYSQIYHQCLMNGLDKIWGGGGIFNDTRYCVCAIEAMGAIKLNKLRYILNISVTLTLQWLWITKGLLFITSEKEIMRCVFLCLFVK